MGNRINGFYVALDKDLTKDQFSAIQCAVTMIKGVRSTRIIESNIEDYMNRSKLKAQLLNNIIDLFETPL